MTKPLSHTGYRHVPHGLHSFLIVPTRYPIYTIRSQQKQSRYYFHRVFIAIGRLTVSAAGENRDSQVRDWRSDFLSRFRYIISNSGH